MRKLTLKISRYLLLLLPKGYITRHEYLQHFACDNYYARDRVLKQFMDKGYIEAFAGRKVKHKDEYIELNIYALTPKGLLHIKKEFSEFYPWLSYVDIGNSESYFRKNFSFDLQSIEQSKIGAYLALAGIDMYTQYDYMTIAGMSGSESPVAKLIAKAQRKWIYDTLIGCGVEKDSIDDNISLAQICEENDLDYTYFDERLNYKYIHPNMDKVATETNGVYFTREVCLGLDDANVQSEGAKAFNLNNSGIVIHRCRPYNIYYYWNSPPFIVKYYIRKIYKLIWMLQKHLGLPQTATTWNMPASFVIGKNLRNFKFMIEKMYISGKASSIATPFYKIVSNLYLTPTIQEHLQVFKILINEPERMKRLIDRIRIERGYIADLSIADYNILLNPMNKEWILCGFTLDACSIFRIYEKLQNYNIEGICNVVREEFKRVPRKLRLQDRMYKIYSGKRADKDTWRKRVYCKPINSYSYPRIIRILCFEYQKSFYNYLFKDWVECGNVIIETIESDMETTTEKKFVYNC